MADELKVINLIDAYDEDAARQAVRISYNERGIALHFPGYGDRVSGDTDGEPVFIEYRNGVPHVVIWADIQQEDPTHIISLEGAKVQQSCPG